MSKIKDQINKTVNATVDSIIAHIEKNINKTYYDERKMEVFFEKVFAL